MNNMAVPVFYIISALLMVGTGNCESLTPDGYWNKVFPTTPMPNFIRQLLTPSPSGFGHDMDNNPRYGWSLWGGMSGDHGTDSWGNWSRNLAPLCFLREDLQPGSKMNVTMMITPVADDASTVSGVSFEPTFLPRKQAQEIPFSTHNLTTILTMFSVQPDSEYASLIRQTLDECEAPAVKREVKHCATSLESMIDFAVAEFRTSEIHAVVTSAANRKEAVKVRSYRIGAGGGKMMSNKAMACHNTVFPYAVFYCHNFAGTKAYKVPLVADDGSRVNAIALCHFDTSNWNPGHFSFQMLGVKPRTVPICHFILKGLTWVSN